MFKHGITGPTGANDRRWFVDQCERFYLSGIIIKIQASPLTAHVNDVNRYSKSQYQQTI